MHGCISPFTSLFFPTNHNGSASRLLSFLMSLVTVAEASSSRSTCRACKTGIDKGALRIGIEAWVAGRQSMTWQHPLCFTSSLVVEVVTKGATGSCKQTRVKIEKGSIRTTVRSNTAKFYLSVAGVYNLAEAIAQAAGSSDIDYWCLKHIKGLACISEEYQRNWLAGLKEKGIEPVVCSPASVTSTSTKSTTLPASTSNKEKKHVIKKEEIEFSDGSEDSESEEEEDLSCDDDDFDNDSDREEVMPKKKVRKFAESAV